MNTFRTLFASAALLASSTAVVGQTLTLEDFGDGGNTTGSVIASTSWVGQLSQGLTTLTVGGTARSDSGWGAVNLTLPDVSLYSYVGLTLQLQPDNAASTIAVTFDDGSDFQTVTFLASAFSTSSFTTVYVPIIWALNTTTIEAWNIGGGIPPPANDTPAFRMIFDNLELSATGAPIPEPSTYAAIFGVLALGLVAYRRRRSAA